MTPQHFAAGLQRLRAPAVLDIQPTKLAGIFLVTFARALDDGETRRLALAGFEFMTSAYDPAFYQMKWHKPTKERTT